MRLIDVDELKKRATKVMFRDAPECGEFDAVAVDDIDCIPTIDPESLRSTATIWHDAQTDPPTENGEYQCYYEYYRYGNYNCMYRTMDRGQFFNGQWSGEPTRGRNTKVLYWMPLPKPPEAPP